MTLAITRSVDETTAAGRAFADTLRPGDVVAMIGELGAGKTHFVTGVCAGLAAEGHIASPTFTLIHEYRAPGCTVIHADMYRIGSVREAFDLGLAEYFQPPYITLIEWADRILDLLPEEHYLVELRHRIDPGEREIAVRRSREGRP
ncbi:MAG: tRNA (adenosine(37)-N6)-threonylcarbamoyltransferase complex ATPase subunit type 1 TsaE [Ignavibacteriae bacterium]|nr:tRNA (adenosine(37)-N6)-threonylcarbamoyltransferase complex ATPase subunit type 1 TsaE [Ignavibacteriota bacterium]